MMSAATAIAAITTAHTPAAMPKIHHGASIPAASKAARANSFAS
jgi:hypothetical protein